MSQGWLEKAERHARFTPRRGPRVAQRVPRGPRVDTAGPQGGAQGLLHAVARQGCGGRRPPQTAPAWSRQKPHGVAVGVPGLAKHRAGRLWQRHLPVLRPYAVAHVDDHPGPINIGHLQGGAFLQPQATGREGAQAGARAGSPHTLEDRVAFLQAEDDRELVRLGGPHEGQRGPFPLARLCVEERDAAPCDGAGAARGVLDVLEGEAVVTPCVLRDPGRGRRVMCRQWAHGPDIHLLGPLGQAAELEVLEHAWAQWGHGSPSCT